jgi:hypothetical protein
MLRSVFCIALLFLITASALVAPAYSLLPESGPLTAFSNKSLPYPEGADVVTVNGLPVDRNAIKTDFELIDLGELEYNGSPGRTLVYGSGNVAALGNSAHFVGFGGSIENGQPLLGVAVSQSPLPSSLGFSYAPDSPLQFDFNEDQIGSPGRLSGSSIIGSDRVADKYGVTGDGVIVAIVDTGTDFANPDMMHSLARDENGVPMMLDADGQGIVLTRATYIAKTDGAGRVVDGGFTEDNLPGNITSWVYVNETGTVFLNTSVGDIPTYNSLYPIFGPPVVNATARVDWIIGHSPSDYIRSASGIYRFGIIYQTQQQFGTITFGLVPVLVVDSEEPGVYDTIIPDMYSGWYFYTQNELARLVASQSDIEHLFTDPSFDFTDDVPIKLGDGNEFLTYDYNDDGFPDFSAGTAGARVVDLWQVATNKTKPAAGEETGYGGVVVANLLEPLDPAGDYFGVMYDLAGHGTGTASTVASKGEQQYDIYTNGTKYGLAGIAPGAKIMPVKALWAGDSLYAWLYASGFNLREDGVWRYGGDHKADIVSNSWGVASFPLLQYGPGYDILSVLSSLLAVPDLVGEGYPGTLFVNSLGNNGLGYGSVGTPNSSPLAISVGATTNNVHVGYDGFQNITRFGNAATYYDEVADFSSRGPGLFGDPKPELMAIGSYAFTPAIVNLKNLGTSADDPNNDNAFALFGGTSMAAPMVAGAAALVIEDLRSQGREVDPFEVRTILMSSAVDLKNDPFVQGSGRVDALAAVELAEGETGRFSAYTDDTVPNVLSVMSGAINSYSNVLGIIDGGQDIAEKLDARFKDSRWFAGYVAQGALASTEIEIENPSSEGMTVEVSAVIEKLVARYEIHNATRPFESDPVHNSDEFDYVPNYYSIQDMGGIPEDADLMVARVTFPFESFMNQTEVYANHLRIASLYAYDWSDSDSDGKISYTENSMINRGGSWGTVQELRVSDPDEKFKNVPLIGVYPVPTVFSFWQGDRQINSTAMNYTLTIEFYERQPNPSIWLDGATDDKVSVTLDPESKALLDATIYPADALPGIYYGSIIIEPVVETEKSRPVVMPVSYVVTTTPVPKDVPVVAVPDVQVDEQDLGLRPNGYVGGLFDMTSRYSAGDWRSYYFTVEDNTITSMTLKISWPHNSTSISAMAYGPDGRMVASSVPSGVFETFAGWPSNDWLGTTSFSEGGAFYFSQNAGENSTLLHVPVNGTGVYSVLLHNTVFHGNNLYEPLQVEAKFSTILPDSAAPAIMINLPKYVGESKEHNIPVAITEENLAGYNYAIDGGKPIGPDLVNGTFDITIDTGALAEGTHTLRIDTSDLVGHVSSFESQFEVDNTPPSIDVFVQALSGNQQKVTGSKVGISQESTLLWNITDKNGVVERRSITFTNDSAKTVSYLSYSEMIDPASKPEDVYPYSFEGEDVSGNHVTRNIEVIIDKTPPTTSLSFANANPQDLRDMATIVLGADDPNIHSMTLQVGDRKSLNVTGMSEYELDTTELPDGEYELKLVATDIAGNEGTISMPIMVANAAPHIMLAILAGLAAGGGIASVAWLVFARRRA